MFEINIEDTTTTQTMLSKSTLKTLQPYKQCVQSQYWKHETVQTVRLKSKLKTLEPHRQGAQSQNWRN